MGKKTTRKILFLIILGLVVVVFAKNLSSSFFFKKNDRINLVVYGKYPVFYSLGLTDKVNYKMEFYPDIEIQIPGGYANYRMGALGKLASLERKPQLIGRSFSLITASFIDAYFYHDSEEIFYGGQDSFSSEKMLDIKSLFADKSNIGFFDRIFLMTQFIGKKKQDMINLPPKTGDELIKSYGGYFYQEKYRREKNNLQVVYQENYKTAEDLAKIIENNGIRVVDISQKDLGIKKCEVWENKREFSSTAQGLADFFNCKLKKNNTEISDIILILADLEKEWEIK